MPTAVCIFEDQAFASFFPLTLGQPLFDLRLGAGTLRARWGDIGTPTLLCRDYLADLVRLSTPDAVNEPIASDTLFVNARLLCFGNERETLLARVSPDTIATRGGSVVAARVGKHAAAELALHLQSRISDDAVVRACERIGSATMDVAAARADGSDADAVDAATSDALARVVDTHRLQRIELSDARLLSFPWQLVEHNRAGIVDDFVRLGAKAPAKGALHAGAHIVGPEHVAVGADAVIRAGAVLDASDGPIIIGAGAVVMPNATLIGPVAIGAGSVVKAGARILAGTSVGGVCKVGGEVDEVIFADYSNKQHDGFLGHSYLGSWVNLGAATNNSDLKNNYGPVRMWCAGRVRETGRQFLGLVMGDHTKTGINTMFNTGTVVGFNCNIYSSEMPDTFVPSFSWGHGSEMVSYELEKAVRTAATVMERRGVSFTDTHRRVFERVHSLSARSGRHL